MVEQQTINPDTEKPYSVNVSERSNRGSKTNAINEEKEAFLKNNTNQQDTGFRTGPQPHMSPLRTLMS